MNILNEVGISSYALGLDKWPDSTTFSCMISDNLFEASHSPDVPTVGEREFYLYPVGSPAGPEN